VLVTVVMGSVAIVDNARDLTIKLNNVILI